MRGAWFLPAAAAVVAAALTFPAAAWAGDDKEVEGLVKELGSDEFAARERAQKRLVELGARAVPELERAAASKDAEVRARAQEALRAIRGGGPPSDGARPEKREEKRGPEGDLEKEMEELFRSFGRDGRAPKEMLPDGLKDLWGELDKALRGLGEKGMEGFRGFRTFRFKDGKWELVSPDEPPSARPEAEAAPAPDPRRLGVAAEPPGEALRYHLGLADDEGVLLQKVGPGSRAEKAGLQPYDIVVAIDGRKATSVEDLKAAAADGAAHKLAVIRRGARSELDLPAPPPPAPEPPAGAKEPEKDAPPKVRKKDVRSF